MGTRSLTEVVDEHGEVLITLYRQYDGDLEYAGMEIADLLQSITLTNGIKIGETRKVANGMGCLAAQLVAHFKDGAGQFYLYPPKTRGVWEEFLYRIEKAPDSDTLLMSVVKLSNEDETFFKGTAEEFKEYVANIEK